jgi:hypothetical protein
VNRGYLCDTPLRREPVWLALRGQAVKDRLVERASEMRRHARERFEAAGGAALLGLL